MRVEDVIREIRFLWGANSKYKLAGFLTRQNLYGNTKSENSIAWYEGVSRAHVAMCMHAARPFQSIPIPPCRKIITEKPSAVRS